MRNRVGGVAVAVAVVFGGTAMAQDLLDARQAKRALFDTKGAEGSVAPEAGLSERDAELLAEVAKTQKYYGAIAVSPDEGLLSPATVAAANYHSVEPARTAALAECNDKRKSGTAPCIIAADILPRRYEAGRPIQLNMDATDAVGGAYRRMRGDKAFAISQATGAWGFGATDAEAIAACADKGGTDCAVLLRN